MKKTFIIILSIMFTSMFFCGCLLQNIVRVRPRLSKKNRGDNGRLQNISSLINKKRSDKFGIFGMHISIAVELNVGNASAGN